MLYEICFQQNGAFIEEYDRKNSLCMKEQIRKAVP